MHVNMLGKMHVKTRSNMLGKMHFKTSGNMLGNMLGKHAEYYGG